MSICFLVSLEATFLLIDLGESRDHALLTTDLRGEGAAPTDQLGQS